MKFLTSSNHRDWSLCLNSSCLLSIWMNCRRKFYNFSSVNSVVVFSLLNFYWHVSDAFVQLVMWQRLISLQKIESRNQILLKYTRVNLLNLYDEMHEKRNFVNQFVDMYFEKTTLFSLKRRRNVININENSNASLKEDELNNDEMKYEKKTKSWDALCDYLFCHELTFLRKSFFCDSKLNLLLVKIYLKDIFIFLKNILTCSDIHTTNIFMTRDYHDYHFRKSITNRYLLWRNLYETWSKIYCISLLLILQCMLFATFHVNNIYSSHIYNYF